MHSRLALFVPFLEDTSARSDRLLLLPTIKSHPRCMQELRRRREDDTMLQRQAQGRYVKSFSRSEAGGQEQEQWPDELRRRPEDRITTRQSQAQGWMPSASESQRRGGLERGGGGGDSGSGAPTRVVRGRRRLREPEAEEAEMGDAELAQQYMQSTLQEKMRRFADLVGELRTQQAARGLYVERPRRGVEGRDERQRQVQWKGTIEVQRGNEAGFRGDSVGSVGEAARFVGFAEFEEMAPDFKGIMEGIEDGANVQGRKRTLGQTAAPEQGGTGSELYEDW
jgi:hypothetical protein